MESNSADIEGRHQPLVLRLQSAVAHMAPHQRDRQNGRLLIECLEAITDTKTLTAEFRRTAGYCSEEAADRLEELERELAAERALADRLASVLRTYNYDLLAGETIQFVPEHDIALAAWKEARHE